MNPRNKLRSKLTGFILGKYNLEKEVEGILIKDEEYISGIEIIFYDELLLFIALVSSILTLFFAITISVLLLVLLSPISILSYFALDLELSYLTNERIIIERRTILEKILKTSNIKSISLDQIAVISYSRAPFHIYSLLLSAIGLVLTILNVNRDTLVLPTIFVIFPISLYLAYYGFRLTKRSIEISVIGVPKPFGIGRIKGAPLWFLNDLQNMIFERVHHTFHIDEEARLLQEFPLQYSEKVKELVKSIKKPLQRKILQLLDDAMLAKKQIVDILGAEFTKIEIDEAMRQLRQIQYVFYHRVMKKWCLNRDAMIKDMDKMN